MGAGVLEQAQARLRDECDAAGKLALYEAVGPNESGGDSESYEQVAARLRLSQSAIKSAAFRLRQRYREMIREEVARTVSDPRELEREMRHLLDALSK